MTVEGYDKWQPKIGDVVYLNYPDHDAPLGQVIAFVGDPGYEVEEGAPRIGQPIIADLEDNTLRVTHPIFLLPFPYRSEQWLDAEKKGLIQ